MALKNTKKAATKSAGQGAATKELESRIKMLSYISYGSLAIAIIAILVGSFAIISLKTATAAPNTTATTTIAVPGTTLAGINTPLNSTQLSVINNAPNSYFETAGEMLLNGSIVNTVGTNTNATTAYIANGKPSVLYLGSTTCIFCGENRWAMALALSRFGQFSSLYNGYSSLGDGDVPTLYWKVDDLNASGADLGNSYTSIYVNFISIEDTYPITGGFNIQPLSTIQGEINSAGNATYIGAINKIIAANNFQGTPYTVWGNYTVRGADAEIFGNTPPTATAALPIASMTHAQILGQFANPKDQFAWGEYAAADLYVAMTCSSIGNTAPVCQLPAIQRLEQFKQY